MVSKYNINIINRGEQIIYSDDEIKLVLERTYYHGHRLYCSSTTADDLGNTVSFIKRKSIVENLCEYFETINSPTIFVVDEADIDRKELEQLLTSLISNGQKITIEYDSAKKRAQLQDEMCIGFLKAGKKVSINDIQFENVEEYLKYKLLK